MPLIAIPSAKNAIGNGYALRNLCTPFYEYI